MKRRDWGQLTRLTRYLHIAKFPLIYSFVACQHLSTSQMLLMLLPLVLNLTGSLGDFPYISFLFLLVSSFAPFTARPTLPPSLHDQWRERETAASLRCLKSILLEKNALFCFSGRDSCAVCSLPVYKLAHVM